MFLFFSCANCTVLPLGAHLGFQAPPGAVALRFTDSFAPGVKPTSALSEYGGRVDKRVDPRVDTSSICAVHMKLSQIWVKSSSIVLQTKLQKKEERCIGLCERYLDLHGAEAAEVLATCYSLFLPNKKSLCLSH